MKAFFTVLAIGGFFASSIANPITLSTSIGKRQDDDYAALDANLVALLTSIQKQTRVINATLEAVPENPTESQVTDEVAAIAPQLQAITDLLTAANAKVVAKRALIEARHGNPDLFKTLSIIIYELLGTVNFILIKLGLGMGIIHLTPLVLALNGLLFSLDLVVGGVLLAVGALVNDLLKTVGLGLIGIV